MASVRAGEARPPRLTVELAEAKLHYGLGETDALLRLLAAAAGEGAEPAGAPPTRQQLYHRHRRSVDGLGGRGSEEREEREEGLQGLPRARSLSPSRAPGSRGGGACSPRGGGACSRGGGPSAHQVHQPPCREVSDSSRAAGPPPGEEGRHRRRRSAETQHLLRDYGRAREEARGEEAPARERLRLRQERTELERRRGGQQPPPPPQHQQHATAHAAAAKDAGRSCPGTRTSSTLCTGTRTSSTLCTGTRTSSSTLGTRTSSSTLCTGSRTSSSTLCTGSSLSLSSGHTSGYVSGHTTLTQDPARLHPPSQEPGTPDQGSKVRGGRPLCDPQRCWPSAQVPLRSPGSGGFQPLLTSSPSGAGRARHRSSSFGSAPSVSAAYQDVASGLLSRALLEIRLAAAADTANLLVGKASAGWRHQGAERGVQAYHRPSHSPTAHGFLGAGELDGPLADVWALLRQPAHSHLYNPAVRSAWTRPLDGSTQLVYLLTNPSVCHLSQPRDFCCISVASKQGGVRVLALQSVFEESLPRPGAEAVRGEMLPSAWLLQPITRGGREVVRVVYLLQVDLGSPSLPSRLLGSVARRHAAVIAELGSLLRANPPDQSERQWQ